MYLVIDSALCRNRAGELVFMQTLCTTRNTFSDFDFLGKVVLERHTTKPFHYTSTYNGSKEKETLFGIKNPAHYSVLFVGIVVPDDFNFHAHIPQTPTIRRENTNWLRKIFSFL